MVAMSASHGFWQVILKSLVFQPKQKYPSWFFDQTNPDDAKLLPTHPVAKPVCGLCGQKSSINGGVSCVDRIYIFEILMKNCSKYSLPSQIGWIFSKVGTPNRDSKDGVSFTNGSYKILDNNRGILLGFVRSLLSSGVLWGPCKSWMDLKGSKGTHYPSG